MNLIDLLFPFFRTTKSDPINHGNQDKVVEEKEQYEERESNYNSNNKISRKHYMFIKVYMINNPKHTSAHTPIHAVC